MNEVINSQPITHNKSVCRQNCPTEKIKYTRSLSLTPVLPLNSESVLAKWER